MVGVVSGGAAIASGSVLAGIATLGLVAYLNRYRGRGGALWFMAALTAQATFCVAYGLSLFTFDPDHRFAFEVVAWLGLIWLGPLFLAFALEYTGRGDLVRSLTFAPFVAATALTSVLLPTNSAHGFVWSEFTVVDTLGLATATYTIQPWGYVAIIVLTGTTGLGVLLLLETILSYGPLYRREAAAVALSTIPPAAAFLVWVFDLGPLQGINLAAVAFLPHVALDAYAFADTNMFESNPVTRRVADRTAIDDLGEPILVLDTDDTVVDLNDAALDLYGRDSRVLGASLDELPGPDREGIEAGEVDLRSAGRRRDFLVSYSELTDPNGRPVGRLVVLYDVTLERQREQQLAVLNRVLRHNLKTELTVIRGYARSVRDAVDDETVREWAELIESGSDDLLQMATTARQFERLSTAAAEPVEVDLRTVVSDVASAVAFGHPDVVVRSHVDGDGRLPVRSHADLLEFVVRVLLENAIEHVAGPSPALRVQADHLPDDGGTVEVVVDGDVSIPPSELEPVRRGTEDPLEHAGGIGLWIVSWGARRLGGEVRFEDADDRTTVRIRLPRELADASA